jgi:invasin B
MPDNIITDRIGFASVKPVNQQDAGNNTGPVTNRTTLLDTGLLAESQQAAQAVFAALSDTAAQPPVFTAMTNASPELKEPSSSDEGKTKFGHQETFNLIVSNVARLMEGINLSQLTNRLQFLTTSSAALKESNNALYQQLQQALEASAAAIGQAESDETAWQNAQDNVVTKQAAYDQASAALALLSETDPNYAAAVKTLESTKNDLQAANEKLDAAKSKADTSLQAASEATKAADQKFQQIQGIVNGQSPATLSSDERSLSAGLRLMQLVGQLYELITKNNDETLAKEAMFFQEMQEKRQAEMTKKADEAAAEQKKAASLNKAMGCVGKILGGLITAVSVVGAAFTGGASLALAAVGVALMVGDEISKATTGVSFMEKALSPLMDKVIKPLVDALSKAIAKALEAAGVDANIAGMIGGIAGALLAAALVVAALVVGKSAAGKVASSALGDIVSTTAKKMIPDIAKNLASKAGTVVSSSMKRLLDKVGMKSNDMAMRSYSNTLGTVNNGMTFGTATVQAANGAMQGYQAKKIQDLKAAIAESSALMETIKELLLRLMDNMNSAENNQKTLWATLSDIQMDKAQTNQVILRNNYA